MSWFDNFGSAIVPGTTINLGQLGGDIGGFLGGLFGPDVSGQTPTPGGTQQQPQGPDLSQLIQSLGGLAGGTSGGGASSGPSGYTTPDGTFVADNSPEDRYYKLVDAVWTRIFGFHPDFAQARLFQQMGIQNTDQLQQVILQMPSHITSPDGTPINIGTYEDMLTTGNKYAQQYFGRPIPDTLISQWVASGTTTPDAIQNWFYSHPANDLPADQYGAIWDAANQWTQQYQKKPL